MANCRFDQGQFDFDWFYKVGQVLKQLRTAVLGMIQKFITGSIQNKKTVAVQTCATEVIDTTNNKSVEYLSLKKIIEETI